MVADARCGGHNWPFVVERYQHDCSGATERDSEDFFDLYNESDEIFSYEIRFEIDEGN